jgi:hypothetical protein
MPSLPPRWHLIEWEDLPFCPSWLRDEATSALVRGLNFGGWPAAIARTWGPWLSRQAIHEVTDCCSGGAGPWPGLLARLQAGVCLTDRYPNPRAWDRLAQRFPGRVRAHPEPVDARNMPPELGGCWSFFNSFHHFRPCEARQILGEALARRCPIAIFEALDRAWSRLLLVLLMPLFVLLTNWVGASPRRLIFTYLVPLIPLLLLWDGWVSCFRAYTMDEYHQMVAELDPQGQFHWTVGRLRIGWLPASAPYLLGHPADQQVAGELSGQAP